MSAAIPPCKAVILGYPGVGKTALALRLVGQNFIEDYDPTIEDLYKKKLMIDDELYMADILDTGGWNENSDVQVDWVCRNDVFLLVYDISLRRSFTSIQSLHHQINKIKQSPVPIILVGNKSDRVLLREVSWTEGRALAEGFGCQFLETSASIPDKIDILRIKLVTQARDFQRQAIESVDEVMGKCEESPQSWGRLTTVVTGVIQYFKDFGLCFSGKRK